MAYFERTGAATFAPTAHVTGAWNPAEQHVGPALGLLAHVTERDVRSRRGDDHLVATRLSYDIWGTLPMSEVSTEVRVVRPGRTIELLEATLSHQGRTAVTLRTWFLRGGDTRAIAGSEFPTLPEPRDLPAWDPTTVWQGGFIASAEVRRQEAAPGRALVWVRTDVPLLADEAVGPLARTAGLLDIINGMAVRADPREVAFPNVDLTAHLLREPLGGWIGLDTTVSFSGCAVGLTSGVLHDEAGPLGTVAQTLTLRT